MNPNSSIQPVVVLTFDDCCKSHLTEVAPRLRRLGFGATFFICRFHDQWRREHGEHLLTAAEIRSLQEQGFEIGNHTWAHPSLPELSDTECRREIEQLERFLADAGVAKPVSFAYPGGPFAPNAAPLLKRYGFRFARTTEERPWNPATDDPMRVPSFPIQGEDDERFFRIVGLATPSTPVVLVFHGVPDLVHPWVNTLPERFEHYMNYLKDHGFRVVAMRDIAG